MFKHLYKRFAVIAIAASVSVGLPLNASAATAKKAPHARKPIDIDPTVLRKLLINNSNSVLTGLNSVYQAKEAVNIARGNVLPSISLSAISTAGSSFGLSSVSVLLPFLIPSNWANLSQSENQYAAMGAAFYLAELNSYASAYSLYLTILSDQQNFEVVQRQAVLAKEVEDVTTLQHSLGYATDGDLANSQSQTFAAKAAALRVQELLAGEMSSFGLMLSLPGETFNFKPIHLQPSPVEAWSVNQLYQAAYRRAPEVRQINYLIAASRAGTWSAAFSFLNSYSITAPTGDNGLVSFSHLGDSTHQVSGGIGFSYGPTLRLSNLNTDAYNLRLKEIGFEELSTVRTVLASVISAAQQVQLSVNAETAANVAYTEQIGLYRQGQTSIVNVRQAATVVLNYGIARIQAQTDLDNQRVTLQRIMISDEFAKISNCNIQPGESGIGGPIGALVQLLDPNSTQISVDDLCRGRANRSHTLASVQGGRL